nr:hypothetical protein [Tanacetum cinerariifolium]
MTPKYSSQPHMGIFKEVGVITFRNVIGANYLSHSTEYAEVPSLETISAWFSTIRYSGKIRAKGTLKKSCLPHSVDEPLAFKAPKTSLKAKKKDTKGTSLELSHLVKDTQSSSAKDTNQSQPPASTHVVARIHKEVQQATGGPTSLRATSEEGAHPQLSNVVSAITTKPLYSASIIPLSKSASRNEASADSTTEVDLGKTYPNDSVSQQQGIVIGTKNFLFHHIFIGNDPHVLVKKTKSTSEGLETVLTQPATRKGASYVEKDITFTEKDASFGANKFLTFPDLSSSNDTKKEIKLEDLSKLVPNLDVDFLDLDSPEDDQPIIVKDEEGEEVHAKKDDAEKVQPEEPKEAEHTLATHPLSPSSIQIQELTNQVLFLLSQIYKLEPHKLKAKAEVALLSAQPSF